jgi:hypothetical protein
MSMQAMGRDRAVSEKRDVVMMRQIVPAEHDND